MYPFYIQRVNWRNSAGAILVAAFSSITLQMPTKTSKTRKLRVCFMSIDPAVRNGMLYSIPALSFACEGFDFYHHFHVESTRNLSDEIMCLSL